MGTAPKYLFTIPFMKKFKPKTVEYDYIGFFLHNLVQLSCKLLRDLILKSIKANAYIKLSPINPQMLYRNFVIVINNYFPSSIQSIAFG